LPLEKALTLLLASAPLHVAPLLQMQTVLITYHPVLIKKMQQQNSNHWNFKCFPKAYHYWTQVYPSQPACVLK